MFLLKNILVQNNLNTDLGAISSMHSNVDGILGPEDQGVPLAPCETQSLKEFMKIVKIYRPKIIEE